MSELSPAFRFFLSKYLSKPHFTGSDPPQADIGIYGLVALPFPPAVPCYFHDVVRGEQFAI
jgi:hypothetical protein